MFLDDMQVEFILQVVQMVVIGINQCNIIVFVDEVFCQCVVDLVGVQNNNFYLQ